jgi:hypothetical protein
MANREVAIEAFTGAHVGRVLRRTLDLFAAAILGMSVVNRWRP